jgi:hypothetical protein
VTRGRQRPCKLCHFLYGQPMIAVFLEGTMHWGCARWTSEGSLTRRRTAKKRLGLGPNEPFACRQAWRPSLGLSGGQNRGCCVFKGTPDGAWSKVGHTLLTPALPQPMRASARSWTAAQEPCLLVGHQRTNGRLQPAHASTPWHHQKLLLPSDDNTARTTGLTATAMLHVSYMYNPSSLYNLHEASVI